MSARKPSLRQPSIDSAVASPGAVEDLARGAAPLLKLGGVVDLAWGDLGRDRVERLFQPDQVPVQHNLVGGRLVVFPGNGEMEARGI